MRAAAALALAVVLLAGCGDGDADDHAHLDDDHAAHDWTYEDTGAWGDDCATGEEQSPVDLARSTPKDVGDLEIAYTASEATVVDTGHSVQTTLEDGGTLTLDGEPYTLRQFHFHTPSEHHLDGVPYAAEVHLVHESEDGALAVLGVLVEEGAAHPVVEDVLAHAPDEGDDPLPTTDPVDPVSLLPAGRDRFRYPGSLTTPPCSEGVAWTVLTEPITWSAEQVEHFAERHPDSHRPPQPLNGRVLLHDAG